MTAKRGPVPGTTGRTPAAVAAIAAAAHTAGQSMAHTVAEHYGCSYGAARMAIYRARDAGQVVPFVSRRRTLDVDARAALVADRERRNAEREARRVRAPQDRQPVRCSCGQTCTTRTALGTHCWKQHDRPPTDLERIILTEQVAA